MRTTSGSHRVTSSSEGDLRLSPPLSLSVPAPVLAGIGALVGIAGIRAIANGAAAGIVPVLFAIAWLGILFLNLRAAASIRFDVKARLVRFGWPSMSTAGILRRFGAGGRALPFEAIESVAVTADLPGLAPLAILLRGSTDEIALGTGWSSDDAVEIARAIGERAGCPTGLRSSSEDRTLRTLATAPGVQGVPRFRFIPLLQRVALGVGLFGGVAFLSGFAVHVSASDRLNGFELPLGDAEGLAVDRLGRIYVGSPAYGRIQRYGRDGRFERGWGIQLGKGDLAIEARHDEVAIWVASRVRGRIDGDDRFHLVDDPRGEDGPRPEPRTTRDPRGNLYRLESSFLGPVGVVRLDGENRESIFRQRFAYWLVQSPLPAWLFAFAGAVLYQVAEALRRSNTRTPTHP